MSHRQREYESLTRQALAEWPFAVQSHVDGAWLELSADLPNGGDVPGEELLRRNGELAGGVKFVLAQAAPGLCIQLRAEVPLDLAAPQVRRRIDQAHAGFCTALAIDTVPGGGASDSGGESAIDLTGKLREAGWPAEVRGDGSLAVDLAVPEEFLQGEIEPRSGETRCSVSLAAPDSPVATAPAATALLLLRAGAAIRLARPVLSRPGGAARFEVVLGGDPSPRELDHALAALAVACRLFAREVDVVQRAEIIATRVLAALGGGASPFVAAESSDPPHSVKSNHVPNREEEAQWNRQQPQH